MPPVLYYEQDIASDKIVLLEDDLSTNETRSNLPGPGRTIGRIYDFYGRKLERVLGKTAGRLGFEPRLVEQPHSQVAPEDESSKNETLSNLPGPGRLLGLVYQFYGRKLERLLGKTADRLGFGPHAVERQMVALVAAMESAGHALHSASPRESRKLSKRCMKLLSHTQLSNALFIVEAVER